MKQNREGLLLVLSGPSGVGKGTICQALLNRNPNMHISISATTRAMRTGEVEGVHYFFKTQEEFEQMIREDAFLEYMQVFGMNYYGTPKQYVQDECQRGYDVVLEIDVQGALRVKQVCPDAVLVFIAPPSMEELKSRLIGRGTETDEAIEKRFATASEELKNMPRYDYIVMNDILEQAVDKVERIVSAEKCRSARNQTLIAKLLGGDETI